MTSTQEPRQAGVFEQFDAYEFLSLDVAKILADLWMIASCNDSSSSIESAALDSDRAPPLVQVVGARNLDLVFQQNPSLPLVIAAI